MSESTRTVEVIRVGTIGLDKNYPGKQGVRLRDISELYEGGPLGGMQAVDAVMAKYKRKARTTYMAPKDPETVDRIGIEALNTGGITPENFAKMKKAAELVEQTTIWYNPALLGYAMPALQRAIKDLHARLKGKRLAGINVDVWDQISGAYLGPHNTDKHGTLILPTDREFAEVLQWRLAGGGYSDCFNGERAAGMPGLYFYFPANEGSGSTIKSFPGVSGQQADLPGGASPSWGWYEQGFFARPALRVLSDVEPLQLIGANPIGRRSFQFLWYCADAMTARSLFSYAQDAFTLTVNASGVLEGALFGLEVTQGTTALQAETWYLIQINTEMVGGWNPRAEPSAYEYRLAMQVYLGGALELSITPEGPITPPVLPGLSSAALFTGGVDDGFDELRNLDRRLYSSEIVNYAAFLKNGRVPGKSQGALGSPGW